MVLVCVGAHWFACAWAIQTGFFDSPLETWMGEQGYCVPADNEEGYACVPPWDMYSASIYFAMMSITSIGYGDISATPQNAAEQGVATVLMLLGGMLWSNVVATFCGVIATANPDTTEFRATMDALNRFMSSQQIPPEMQRRLREYFHQSKHLQDTINRRHLLEKMSPQLAGEVALTCNEKWLNKVWFLRGAGQEFVVQIALQLQAMVFTIGEVVSNGFLYIIHRGIALYGGRVLTAGSTWGEDMLLESQWLVGKYCARTPLTHIGPNHSTSCVGLSTAGQVCRRHDVLGGVRHQPRADDGGGRAIPGDDSAPAPLRRPPRVAARVHPRRQARRARHIRPYPPTRALLSGALPPVCMQPDKGQGQVCRRLVAQHDGPDEDQWQGQQHVRPPAGSREL